jgi:hypothetical protein
VRISRLFIALFVCASLEAWNAAGHRTIAYIAYSQLSPQVRVRADTLLRSHPDYPRWVRDVPPAERPLTAFLHASTWADEIRSDPSYHNEPREAPPSTEAPDHFRHQNWHYVDEPIAGDFAHVHIDDSLNPSWREAPNVVTQIRAMETILSNRSKPADARAWALAWLIHLAGDIHQPLHCASRYRPGPDGRMENDAGGNQVLLAAADHNLHAFWDDLLGFEDSPAAVKQLAEGLTAATPPVKGKSRERDWQAEGAKLDATVVYPGLAYARMRASGLEVTPEYRRVALAVAGQRVAVAGYRLAAVLNRTLNR